MAIAPPPPDPDIEVATTDCYSIVGYPDENDRDDLADPTIASVDAEIGQDTVQVLNGISSVQLTVTSCQEGPVYIRFLDSNGDVFGTDVDECETCPDAAGADVVGLDSQGRLELNLMKDYTAAEALMYDQYTLISINPDTANPMERLVGKPGQYYQGKFRFYAPCEWEPFQVQVHEPSGKVLQELQNGMHQPDDLLRPGRTGRSAADRGCPGQPSRSRDDRALAADCRRGGVHRGRHRHHDRDVHRHLRGNIRH